MVLYVRDKRYIFTKHALIRLKARFDGNLVNLRRFLIRSLGRCRLVRDRSKQYFYVDKCGDLIYAVRDNNVITTVMNLSTSYLWRQL